MRVYALTSGLLKGRTKNHHKKGDTGKLWAVASFRLTK